MAAIYIEYSLKKINTYDELLMFVLIKVLVILVNLPLAFLRYCCKVFIAITVCIFLSVPFIVLQAWLPSPYMQETLFKLLAIDKI